MSVSYLGQAVIGCEVTSKIPKTESVRGCKHDVPESFKCCPECGKLRTVEVRVDLDDLPLAGLLAEFGLALASTTDHEHTFAGVVVKAWGDAGPQRLELVNTRERVRHGLESLGLWDAESFGLWIVMYCSY